MELHNTNIYIIYLVLYSRTFLIYIMEVNVMKYFGSISVGSFYVKFPQKSKSSVTSDDAIHFTVF